MSAEPPTSNRKALQREHTPGSCSGCPCGLPAKYEICCGLHHLNIATTPAPTALDLMRSRYSAYALGLIDYLLATWHTRSRPDLIEPAPPQLRWLGLEVRSHTQDGANHATIEFVARSKLNGRAHRLREVSRFVREDGRWYYVGGQLL
jgi:SEC-C motif domain protein